MPIEDFQFFLISSFTLLFANLTWCFNVVKRLNYFFIISPGAIKETAMNSFIPRFKLQILVSTINGLDDTSTRMTLCTLFNEIFNVQKG